MARSLQRKQQTSLSHELRFLLEEEKNTNKSSFLDEVQQNLGNEQLQKLGMSPGSADELYLADLLSLNAQTGEDFRPYLPWNAPAEWTSFAMSWYRVLWAEQQRASIESSSELLADSVGAALGEGTLSDILAGGESFSAETASEISADAAVSRSASRINLSDSAALDDWFERLEKNTGSGRTLNTEEKAFLEAVHHRTIPDARLHEGGFAKTMSEQINARAFTIGNQIWLGQNISLDDPKGAELLAHEITHVIQNSLGRMDNKSGVSSPGQPSEVEAEARGREAAALVTRGWQVEAPEGMDGRGRMLAAHIAGQLPEEAPPAPESVVQESLKTLLERKADSRLHAGLSALDETEAERKAVLEDARIRVQAAGTDPASLSFLLSIAGAPSQAELQSAITTPYPDLFARMSALLSRLAPSQVAAAALSLPEVPLSQDPQTTALLARITSALGLSSSSIALDQSPEAQATLNSLHTRGLYQDGTISLHAGFDPATREGKALLAHEVTHAAQDLLPAADHAAPGLLAEAEAHDVSDRFVSGTAFEPLVAGLPEGHVAAEGPGGGDLDGLLNDYRTQADATKGKMAKDGKLPNKGDPNASENREKKLEAYGDGVDGVADEIGDLDAFDDLIEAIDDDEDTKGPLGRVKASKHYKDLCDMWQGAKDGKDDSAQMQQLFNSEFDGRGFWGDTEKAFDMVCAAAKADAKRRAEAEAGLKNVQTAKDGEKNADTDGNGEGDQGKTDAAKGGANDLGVQGKNGAIAAQLDASVNQKADPLAAFDAMPGDEQLDGLLSSVNKYKGFAQNAESPALSRTKQISEALFENFASSFATSFVDQGIDTLVWDTIGKAGDKALSALTKGKLSTPFIGPAIGLGKNFYDSWDSKKSLGENMLAGTKASFGVDKFGASFESFGKIGETLDNLAHANNAGDVIGILCAAAADFFQGMRDFLDGLASVCSTLSALCYIVGGILILVGIATAWLGWGAGLISAGGWLVRIGGILARINTALGMIVTFLSGVVLFFRTIAAFLVPADLYASQLKGVGDAAGNFGEKAGAKVGDMAANDLKNRASNKDSPPASKPNDQDNTGDQAGGATAKKVDDGIDKKNKVLEDSNKKLEDLKKTIQEDEHSKKKTDDADESKKKKTDDGPEAKKSFTKRLLADLNPVTQAKEVAAGVKDLWKNKNVFSKDVRNRATVEAGVLKNLDDALTRMDEKIAALKAEQKQAWKDGADPAEIASYQKQIDDATAALQKAKTDLADLKAKLGDDGKLQKDLDDEAAAADAKKKSPLEEEIAKKQKAKADLDESVKKAQADSDAAQKKLKDVADLENQAKEHDANAQKHQKDATLDDNQKKQIEDARSKAIQDHADQQAKLNKQVDDLQKKRDAAHEKVTQADESIKKAESRQQAGLNGLEQKIGSTIVLKRDNSNGGRSTSDHQLRGVETDGVIVSDGKGKTKKVPFSEVFGPPDLAGNAKKVLDSTQALKDAKEQKTNAQNESTAAQKDLSDLQGHWEDAQRPPSIPKHPLEEKQSKAQSDANKESDAAKAKKAQADKLKTDAADKKKKLDDLNAQQKKAADDLKDTEDRKKRVETVQNNRRYTQDSSSGNATGGVGSSYKGLAEQLVDKQILQRIDALLEKLGLLKKEVPEAKPGEKPADAPAEEEKPKTIGGRLTAGTEELLGIKVEKDAALEAIGKKQAAVERVLELAPPVDIDKMKEHKLKALEARNKYLEHHTWAYKAFMAEQSVEIMSKQTKQLAEAGDPILQSSKKMEPGLTKSRSDEDQRMSIISGQDTKSPKAQDKAGGFIVELIAKLADNSDAMNKQPDGGGSEAGTAIDEGGQKSEDESKDKVGTTKDLSQKQRQFLDQAISVRAGQEEQMSMNITNLNQKYDEEQGIKAEIQVIKAQAIVERDNQRQLAESEAQAFTSDFEALSAWKVDFDSRIAKVEEEAPK
jgi:hypothetical protein